MNHVYEPSDDSFMLAKKIQEYGFGDALEIGTGSGFLAETIAGLDDVKSVVAVDKNKDAVKDCKIRITNKKIKFKISDLFSKVKGRYDTIVFNPPYLPEGDDNIKDSDLVGGKKGYETITRFIEQVNDYLNPEGIILIVFSSLTNKEMVDSIIQKNLFEFELLEEKSFFFEKLYVYMIKKSILLKSLSENGLKRITPFSEGRRGLILKAILNKNDVAIKIKHPDSKAINRIANESNWLKKLNKDIGPSLIRSSKDYLIYLFVKGIFIEEFINKSSKNKILNLIKKVFQQMRTLDLMKVDKEEMHHPYKHIIISKHQPVLVDFERCRFSEHPKNVTQFCQFIVSGKFSNLLRKKEIFFDKKRVIEKARIYKKSYSEKEFKEILYEIDKIREKSL